MIAARGSSDNAGVYAKYLFQAFNGLPVAMATPSLYTFYHTPPRLKDVFVLGHLAVRPVGGHRGGAGRSTTAGRADAPPSPRDAAFPAGRAVADESSSSRRAPKRRWRPRRPSPRPWRSLAAPFRGPGRKQRSAPTALGRLPELAAANARRPRAGPAAARAPTYRYMQPLRRHQPRVLLRDRHGDRPEAEGAHLCHGGAVLVRGFPARAHGHGRRRVSRGPARARGSASRPHGSSSRAELQERKPTSSPSATRRRSWNGGDTALPYAEGAPEWLSPILAVLPGQLFALRLSQAKGIDPDVPRGCSKVTVTRWPARERGLTRGLAITLTFFCT